MNAPVKMLITGGVARITLDRAHKRNALDRAMIADLIAALDRCESDAGVRVVEITGAGKIFCAGADLADMQAQAAASEAANLADARQLAELLSNLEQLSKPTLARVNGDGYGGALGLLGACDIVIVALHAKFAFTEVRLGIIPAVISPFVLPKIGERAARRYWLTAETLTAAALVDLGLAHEAVPADMLEARCLEITASLLQAAPGALREAKALIRDVASAAPKDKRATAAAMGARLARLRVQAEAREGFSAFFAKRKPTWRVD